MRSRRYYHEQCTAKTIQFTVPKHLNALTRQGKAQRTIDSYSRAVRRITEFYDQCPDKLTLQQLKECFLALVNSHSWSTVKVDRNGLQFFYEHVLAKQWTWVDIVKPSQIKRLPDILTVKEIKRLINGTRGLRYQTFILVTYNMGLRIGEALNFRVDDIDSEHMKVHIRLSKSKKDRFVTLPKPTLLALQRYWASHRNPKFLFPHGKHPAERLAARHVMDRGGLKSKVLVS